MYGKAVILPFFIIVDLQHQITRELFGVNKLKILKTM
jgi:hypothetical protein